MLPSIYAVHKIKKMFWFSVRGEQLLIKCRDRENNKAVHNNNNWNRMDENNNHEQKTQHAENEII